MKRSPDTIFNGTVIKVQLFLSEIHRVLLRTSNVNNLCLGVIMSDHENVYWVSSSYVKNFDTLRKVYFKNTFGLSNLSIFTSKSPNSPPRICPLHWTVYSVSNLRLRSDLRFVRLDLDSTPSTSWIPFISSSVKDSQRVHVGVNGTGS